MVTPKSPEGLNITQKPASCSKKRKRALRQVTSYAGQVLWGMGTPGPNRIIIWMFSELKTLLSLELILGVLGESSRPQHRLLILGSQGSPDMCELGFPEPRDTSDRASLHRDIPVLLAWWRLIAGQGRGGAEGLGMFLNAGSAVRDGPSTSLLLSVFTSFLVSSSLSSENSYNGEGV